MCDHFTKFVQCYAISDQTAKTVASKFIEFFMLFGIPENILTDQGKNFQSDLISNLYELLDIHRLRTTPYYPQCDGITERFNATFKDMLNKQKSEDN